ncbi:HpcH/HpaI aldolase family protein [Hyphococcus luteus]|uniref:2-dehydro-3-deoxyglucarate aldolase n=1 Tax=Hyphococcus luteus TaxID=2058213 RepID=A0A2S7K1I4_9PROT|nr:aldolase/citrate lyase family protein [Marinicaulis flavus]PQA86359.1 2-dehydro-3-deoxyglucarate aldolase [Marinicaulis flavus]
MKQFHQFCAERGGSLLGTWLKIPSLATVEMMGHAGFDFLVIDMEHAPHSLDQVYQFIFATQASGMAALVRLPDHNGSDIQRLLDSGADGLLAPRMTSVETAERLTNQMLFSPKGERGLGTTSRAGRWGLAPMEDYLKRGDEECLRMVQLENWETLNAVEDYLAVPGVNGVFVGHGDLYLSSGKPASDPEVRQLTQRVCDAARKAGKLCGAAAATPEDARIYREMGYSLVMVSNDATLFAKAAADAVAQSKSSS